MTVNPLFSDEDRSPVKEHVYRHTHPFVRGMKDVLRLVNKHQPRTVLDVGSPLAQNVAVSYLADLTMLDVRVLEDKALGLNVIQGSACAIPFPDKSQELVTSLWVMCHVGDGRYGDVLELDGDKKMLQEVHRVLRSDGLAVLGIGPMDEAPGLIFNVQRIYSWPWIEALFKEVGFVLLEKGEYPISKDMFIEHHWQEEDAMVMRISGGVYGFAVLQKASS